MHFDGPTAHDNRTDVSATLEQQVAALLNPLGGRTAVAARRVQARGAVQRGDAYDIPAELRLRAGEVFPAASLAKLPIAVELLRRSDLGQFSLDERFATADEPRAGGEGLLDYLNPATMLTLADLCLLMLAVSDNTAANFLLNFLGRGEVNETLARMNLPATHIARLFQDWEARAGHHENTTSADDMLALLGLVQANAVPGARHILAMLGAQQRNDELRAYLPEGARLASKSGSLDGIAHEAGIVQGPAGSCLFCLLTAEQEDIPATRRALAQTLRLLWDAWCGERSLG